MRAVVRVGVARRVVAVEVKQAAVIVGVVVRLLNYMLTAIANIAVFIVTTTFLLQQDRLTLIL